MTQDNRVTIEIDLDEDLLYQLMLKAHEHDSQPRPQVEEIANGLRVF